MKNLSKILTFLLLITAFLLVSCRDDVVAPKNEVGLDSSRFNWQKYNIQDFAFAIWGLDTNKIYILGSSSLTILANNTIQYNNYGEYFYPNSNCITGYDENHVYIGGRLLNQFNRGKVKLWNGSFFEDVNLLQNLIRDSESVTGLYAESSNKLWVGTNKGQVICLVNPNYLRYQFDSTYTISHFLKDENNNFYLDAIKFVNINGNINIYRKFYKYEVNRWDSVFYNYSSTGYLDDYHVAQVGNYIFSIFHNGIFKFNGNSFSEVINIQDGITPSFYMGGSSLNDVLISGYYDSLIAFRLFDWNGNKWSMENVLLTNSGAIKKIKNKYYCLSDENTYTFLYVGTPLGKSEIMF